MKPLRQRHWWLSNTDFVTLLVICLIGLAVLSAVGCAPRVSWKQTITTKYVCGDFWHDIATCDDWLECDRICDRVLNPPDKINFKLIEPGK